MTANIVLPEIEIVNRTIEISPVVLDIMAGDVGSKRLRFCADRFYEGVDLSLKDIVVNYVNSVQVVGKSESVTISDLGDEKLSFDWVIDGTPTEVAGVVTFDIEFYKLDDQGKLLFSWHTKPAKFTVGMSLAQRGDSLEREAFLEAAGSELTQSALVDSHPHAVVNGRNISMPSIEDAIVSNDARSALIAFDVPRYYDGVDLSEKIICIKFVNALETGGRAVAVNALAEGERLTFGWLIDGRVTVKSGDVRFALEFLGKDENGGFFCWQSQTSKLKITQGLEVTKLMEEPMPDWNQQWLLEAQNIVENVKLSSEQAQECAQLTTQDAVASAANASLAQTAKADAQQSAVAAAEQALEALAQVQEAVRLNGIVEQHLLQFPIRRYVTSIEERDALTGMKNGEMCYVCSFAQGSTDVYIWDTGDIEGDGVSPEWVLLGSMGAAALDRNALLAVLNLATVALSGDYADLSDKPPRYQPFGVLEGGNAEVVWDFAQHENAIVTFSGTKSITVQNAYAGAVGVLLVNAGTLTLPAGSKKRADFDYVTGSTYEYSFVYDGNNYFWQRSAYNG